MLDGLHQGGVPEQNIICNRHEGRPEIYKQTNFRRSENMSKKILHTRQIGELYSILYKIPIRFDAILPPFYKRQSPLRWNCFSVFRKQRRTASLSASNVAWYRSHIWSFAKSNKLELDVDGSGLEGGWLRSYQPSSGSSPRTDSYCRTVPGAFLRQYVERLKVTSGTDHFNLFQNPTNILPSTPQ